MVQGLSKRIAGKLDDGKVAANDTAKARRLIAVIDDAASADLAPPPPPAPVVAAPIVAVAPAKAVKRQPKAKAVVAA